jgi:hypothetical protein
MDFQKELIAEYDRETAKTRKMLEAIPADADFTYKPHPKSMSLGRLAGHLAETCRRVGEDHLHHRQAGVPGGPQVRGLHPRITQALLERFDKEVAEPRRRLRSLRRPSGTRTGSLSPAARPGSTIPSTVSSATGCWTT